MQQTKSYFQTNYVANTFGENCLWPNDSNTPENCLEKYLVNYFVNWEEKLWCMNCNKSHNSTGVCCHFKYLNLGDWKLSQLKEQTDVMQTS